jgi:hypothetical protein
MRSIVRLLLVSAALAAPASAAVLIDDSGDSPDGKIYPVAWSYFAPHQTYRFELVAEKPLSALAFVRLGFCYDEFRLDGSLASSICDNYEDYRDLGVSTSIDTLFETRGYHIRREPCRPDRNCFFRDWEQLGGIVLLARDSGPIPFHVRLESVGVPEPASWALMIAGFGLLGATARRRSRAIQQDAARRVRPAAAL